MNMIEVIEDIQTAYSYWKRLYLSAAKAYGPSDEATVYYAAKLELVRAHGDLLGLSVDHLDNLSKEH